MIRIRKSSQRSGAILIVMLVCLGVATTILFTVIQSSIRARRQLQSELQMEQTKWLVDAGIRRAGAQLSNNDEYSGESIKLDNALSHYSDANVEISISSDDLAEHEYRLEITANLTGLGRYPTETKRSKSVVVAKANPN
ncbi:MAG: type II secretory pathway pseudopilin PulG [Mariniblastus sp.]|jgi:type II secretory pathway pseudopilin PulG